jgi:hypothetical protein
MSYIYVKSDLTFIDDPAAQTLLQAFLRALYAPEWIGQCEDEFGFVRVDGPLRDQALEAIDSMITSAGAPQWTFEYVTEERLGQGDYVISTKRQSYSEVEQDDLVDKLAALTEQIEALKAEYVKIMEETGADDHTHAQESNQSASDEDSQVQAALVMSSISIALWVLAILALLVRMATGSHSSANAGADMDGSSKQESGDLP